MHINEQGSDLMSEQSPKETSIAVEIHRVPIIWDLEKGNLTFFGLDAALFWTDPSLIRVLAPLADEVGRDLFRLLIAHSSSQGTEEDYNAMISTLGSSFEEGFLAWGKAVSSAGWGTFEMPEYHPDKKQAMVVVHNSWECRTQRNLPPDKRWGCPSLQGKLIGIFNHAFGIGCWADETCHYSPSAPRVEFKIHPSNHTIEEELKKLRYGRMQASEQLLADSVDQKTRELQAAKSKIERYSKILELRVAERTAQLVQTNEQLQNEIEIRKAAEAKKEKLILDLQKALKEVKTLRGFLPICASCKKIRDDKGYWNQIETYIEDHSDAEFSHSICPDCAKRLYGDLMPDAET